MISDSNMPQQNKPVQTVGILGGVGPLATIYFMELLIRMTDAKRDQDHLDTIVFNRASIPDRTAFLLGDSKEDPLPALCATAQKLEQSGADFLVMPCNTAHYFYDKIEESISVPFLNMVQETVTSCRGLNRLGLLATSGTVSSNTYQRLCLEHGKTCIVPDPAVQEMVMDIIYSGVKAGVPVDTEKLGFCIQHLRQKGCDAVVLGCTELSVAYRDCLPETEGIVDAMEVLARHTLSFAGVPVKPSQPVSVAP